MTDDLRARLGRLMRKGFVRSRGGRLRHARARLTQSAFFDREWYLATYPDVRDSGLDPARHYLECGWREGRDPGPDFSTLAYLRANPDVAAGGVNPLLHYIEHGHAEGRGAPDHAAPPRAVIDPIEQFGPAAPCEGFPVHRPVVAWARAGRIVAPQADAVEIGGRTVGIVSGTYPRRAFNADLARLAWLSGREEQAPVLHKESAGICLRLVDAWHTGGGIFRSRWSRPPLAEPVVVRAVQHAGPDVRLVGESLVGGDVDLLDAKLVNPNYPLLFLFCAPDGLVLGSTFVTFPALCRGGIHYPELLAVAAAGESKGGLDILSVDGRLASQLARLLEGSEPPLVRHVVVNLAGADGTHPLFQPDYQSWLSGVMRISTAAAPDTGSGPVESYLADAINLEAAAARSEGGLLELASDMVPSISALVSRAGQPGDCRAVGGLVVPRESGSQAWVRIVPPPQLATDSEPSLRDGGLPILNAPNEDSEAPVLALRMPARRALADANRLVPDPEFEPTAANAEKRIGWIINPEDWTEDGLQHSLEALAAQTAGRSTAIFVGPVSQSIEELARRLFQDRVQLAQDRAGALGALEQSSIGYLGAEVVLHDRRTLAVLLELLEDPGCLTASAPIVSLHRHGMSWGIDAAEIPFAASLLPRASVPIDESPRAFWVARSELLKSGGEARGRHLCATRVSVSTSSGLSSDEPLFYPPESIAGGIQIEHLVG